MLKTLKRWFRNLFLLRSKLAFGLLCLLLILLSIGLFSINECSDLGSKISALLSGKDSESRTLQLLKGNLAQITSSLFRSVSDHSPEADKQFIDAEGKFQTSLVKLDKYSPQGKKKALVSQLKAQFSDLDRDVKSWFASPIEERSTDVTEKVSGESMTLLATLDQLNTLFEQDLSDDSKASDSRITTTVRILILGMIVAIIVSIYTSFLLGRRLLDPLVELTNVVKRIGDGNLDQTIPIRSNDEVGSLAASFNTMAVQLRTFRETASEELLRLNTTIRATLASFPYPVFVLNRKGTVELRNPEADKLALKLLFAGVRRLPQKVDEKVDEVLSTGKDFVPTSFSDAIRLQIDEQDRYFLPRIVPLRDDAEVSFGIAVILEDVTRMRLMDELKSNLVATVSHEIKTPLTSVRMATYLLAEEIIGPLNPKQRQLVITAREDADRILKTTDDLLNLAKLEQGPSELDLAWVSPSVLVETAVRNVREIAQAASIEIIPLLAPDLPNVSVDRQRISFVFNNFLTNAIKYSPNGTKIWISAELNKDDPKQMRFAVKDQGPGISAEYSAVFSSDFTGCRALIGMGPVWACLSLVKSSWDMVAKSVFLARWARAANFTSYFPWNGKMGVARNIDNDNSYDIFSNSRAIIYRVMQKMVRVLIVEDNQDDREILVRQLKKINIESNVKFIADGKEALDFLLSLGTEAAGVELVAIFLDLKLPSIDGLTLLEKIRENPELKTMPVIIMTSSINPKHAERCNDLKVTGFISKPITFGSFSRAVADVFHLPSI